MKNNIRPALNNCPSEKMNPIFEKKLYALILVIILLGANSGFCTEKIAIKGISGMAKLDKNQFLVVHDYKSNEAGSRVGVLTLHKHSPTEYEKINISQWVLKTVPSDLESVCNIPNKDLEFLIAESGAGKDKSRIFHISLQQNIDGLWGATYISSFEFLKDTNDNFEGLACIEKAGQEYYILLGERGEGEKKEMGKGKIFWAIINLGVENGIKQEPLKTQEFSTPHPPKNKKQYKDFRNISDLYIAKNNTIWISSAYDPGNSGPYFSKIHQLGTVNPYSTPPIDLTPQKSCHVEGLKIEALSSSWNKDVELSIATDDENYGGIFRQIDPSNCWSNQLP
jgi:hypothetical protein